MSPTFVSDLFSDRSETVSDLFSARSETNGPPPKVIAKPGAAATGGADFGKSAAGLRPLFLGFHIQDFKEFTKSL